MNNYIPADKLIAEIERLAETLPEIRSTMEGLLSSVESLEKEQDVTFRERSILIDAETAITSLQQEQPEVDLKKEIQSFWNGNALEYRLGHVADINFLAYTARHFAEWGAIHLNAKGGINMKNGVELIADERTRQINEEGYSWRHDDEHYTHQLSDAAIVYAAPRTTAL